MKRRRPAAPWKPVLHVLCGALALAGAACKPRDLGDPAAAPQSPSPPSDSLAPAAAPGAPMSPIQYHCDGLDFTVLYDADRVTLQAPGREYVLLQAQAASGAKFQSDKATFWSKGEDALVEIDGRRYENCRERSAAEAPSGP